MEKQVKWLTKMTWAYLVALFLLAGIVIRDEVKSRGDQEKLAGLEKRVATVEKLAKGTEANRNVGVAVSDQTLVDVNKLEKRVAALEAQQKH